MAIRSCSGRAPRCLSRRRGKEGSRGSVIALAAISLPILLGFAGLAIDIGNLYVAHNRLQAAVDAGALAGSLQLPYDPNLSKNVVTKAARDMVGKNYPEAVVESILPGTEVRSVCVLAKADVPLYVMGVLGLASSTLQADACAGFNNLEVVMVIDNTGSMKGTPINRVKDASNDLVDLLLPAYGAPSTKVGLVPFRGKIRVGSNVDGLPSGCRNADGSVNTGLPKTYWVQSSASSNSNLGGYSINDPGRISKPGRPGYGGGGGDDGGDDDGGGGYGAEDYGNGYSPSKPGKSKPGVDDPTADEPAIDPLQSNPTYDPLVSTSDKLVLPPGVSSDTCSSIPVIRPLTTDRTTIINAINSQDALGAASGTVISEGIKWGSKVLTPETPYTEGGSFDDYRKVMIVLTDGDTEDGTCGGAFRATYTPNNYWTNAYYGMEITTCHCNDSGCLNSAVLAEAQKAKDLGIEIFAIRFGDSDNVDRELMKKVASSSTGTDDHYFDAPTADDIDDVFKQIGRQLGWRLLK